MAETKLSPRQKMINMMYIVLIALLALNVDKHVLKAFHLMEKNFISSAESYDQKIQTQMASFAAILSKEKTKAKPYYETALEAQKISTEFDQYVVTLKQEIIDLYDGRLEEEEGEDGLTALKTPEGMEKHAYLFMVKDGGKKGKELQNKINNTRDKLLALLKPNEKDLFVDDRVYQSAKQANLLNADEPASTSIGKRTWATINLEYQPVGALVALLTQYQNNVKALETDVIGKLMYGVNQTNHQVDHLSAAIVPKSNYVMEGENYEADVMLIASSNSITPKISMNGEELTSIDSGVGKIAFRANGIGEKTVKGYIEVNNPKTGEPESYAYNHTYQVFKPVATVSPDALNLLYKSLDNPLSISVPGFSAADIRVEASNGATVSGSNGRYKVNVTGATREVNITVYAKGRMMGTTPFRVRDVPSPDAMLGGIQNTGRAVTRAQLCAQNNVLATLGQDFAYDLPFKVLRYKFIYQPRNRPAIMLSGTGSTLTQAMKRHMCNARSGDRFSIEGIKAKNTKYNITRSVSPMLLRVQ